MSCVYTRTTVGLFGPTRYNRYEAEGIGPSGRRIVDEFKDTDWKKSQAAFDALVGRLTHDGWESDGTEEAEYQTIYKFRRIGRNF